MLFLASLLYGDGQLDAAEETATRVMELSENRDQDELHQSHSVLGRIQASKGNREKAIDHYEASLRITSALNLYDQLSETHLCLADLYFGGDKLNAAQTHVEHARLHARNNMLLLSTAFYISARVLSAQDRPEEAKSEALRALGICKKLGAAAGVEQARQLLEEIEDEIEYRDDEGKWLKWCSLSH